MGLHKVLDHIIFQLVLTAAVSFFLFLLVIFGPQAFAKKISSVDDPTISEVLDNAINVGGISQAKNVNTKGNGLIFLSPQTQTATQAVKPTKDINKSKVEQASKAKKMGQSIARDINKNNFSNFDIKNYQSATRFIPYINLKNIVFYADEPQQLEIQAEVSFSLF